MGTITIKNQDELAAMRKAGRIVAEVFELMYEKIRPGVTTAQLNKAAETLINKRHARPLFKGYGGFPAAVCISVNQEVIHGIPGRRVLQEGDIVSIDVGAQLNGFCGDGARTFAVGRIDPAVQHLLDVTQACLAAGIELAVAGSRLGDIGSKVQQIAEDEGYGVVRDYVGHGIGRELHEAPEVPNFGTAGRGIRLMNGMAIAIEPMINMGTKDVYRLKDGWTVVTKDGLPSAHFENTVAITPEGPQILTVL
ncbi:MAG: type I methionyl aminopeptidase [Peptococcaceae bacterium]|jgi:methionyl aminopeptidase|nr:type I methionyl aminopeptidase [Peptococcaceae bacterium]